MNSYVIIDIEHLNSVVFEDVEDNDAQSVTLNMDGTKFIIEYVAPMPSSLSKIPNKLGPYTTGIYDILDSEEWRYEVPLDDLDGDGMSGSPPPII